MSAPGEAAKLAPLAAYLFWKSTPPTATTPIGLTEMRARSLTAMEYVKRVEAKSREQALMERQDQEARDMARQKREDEATDVATATAHLPLLNAAAQYMDATKPGPEGKHPLPPPPPAPAPALAQPPRPVLPLNAASGDTTEARRKKDRELARTRNAAEERARNKEAEDRLWLTNQIWNWVGKSLNAESNTDRKREHQTMEEMVAAKGLTDEWVIWKAEEYRRLRYR